VCSPTAALNFDFEKHVDINTCSFSDVAARGTGETVYIKLICEFILEIKIGRAHV
jgi:hypothetical protein